MFFLPVRWHAKPLNDRWPGVEAEAMRELRRWVEPPDEAHAAAELRRISAWLKTVPLFAIRAIAYVWIFRHRIGHHLGAMVRGDRSTFARIMWFVRSFMFGSGHSSRPMP
jgi:hypothetical protein